jgi:hypothetical protein
LGSKRLCAMVSFYANHKICKRKKKKKILKEMFTFEKKLEENSSFVWAMAFTYLHEGMSGHN